MEIVTIEKKTFEEMKSRFNQFSEHVRQLCSRYRPPEKMNWLDNAGVCEKLNVTPESLLLVNSDLSVEECEGVSYFWNYRVANCATITQELESMIAKQIESTGNAVLSTD